MNYNVSVPVHSKENLNFEVAKFILLPNEFTVNDISADSILFSGKGMRSTNQPAIHGATKITLAYKTGNLHLHANLGGVKLRQTGSPISQPL